MSATGYLDACGFIPASSGTGDFVVSSAITGYQTPADAGAVNSTVYSYRAESADKSQWEEGFGAYTVSTTTLARGTITANSSGDTSAIDFSAAPNVYIVAASADLENAAMLTSGTLPVERLNGGSADQFVQGDGTFGTQPKKLLNTLTASNSASLSDTTSLTSSYDFYEIVLENIVPSTNDTTLELQVHANGSFQTSSYVANLGYTGSGAMGVAQNTSAIQLSQGSIVQNSGQGLSGVIHIIRPSGTATPKTIFGRSATYTGLLFSAAIFGGMYNGDQAVDGLQILFSSGNIASGTLKVYGMN